MIQEEELKHNPTDILMWTSFKLSDLILQIITILDTIQDQFITYYMLVL